MVKTLIVSMVSLVSLVSPLRACAHEEGHRALRRGIARRMPRSTFVSWVPGGHRGHPPRDDASCLITDDRVRDPCEGAPPDPPAPRRLEGGASTAGCSDAWACVQGVRVPRSYSAGERMTEPAPDRVAKHEPAPMAALLVQTTAWKRKHKVT
jgi:hypothetical protein